MEAVISTFKQMLTRIIEKNVSPDVYDWLVGKVAQLTDKNNACELNFTFSAIHRKTGKNQVTLEERDIKNLETLLPGFRIQNWTIDRVARVWVLMQLESLDKEIYLTRIENLFAQAEMNELVVLYSSLPVLAYPEAWAWRCAEGVRSNIGNCAGSYYVF